tara:strand:+ start:5286 stop:5834 length:549 start_codon:yes stop_codon:yes gene_type:complete
MGSATVPWIPDLVALVGERIYRGYNCMQAWQVIPASTLITAVSEVRNRVLTFVLEIRTALPEVATAGHQPNEAQAAVVHNIFNNYVSGDVGNIAAGSSDFKQKATVNNASAEVFDSLVSALRELNQPAETDALIAKIEDMRLSQGTEGFSKHYQGFMALLADHAEVATAILPQMATLAALLT